MSSLNSKTFEDLVDWALHQSIKKKKTSEMGILYIIGAVIVILLMLWWVLSIFSSENGEIAEEEDNEGISIIDDMNNSD